MLVQANARVPKDARPVLMTVAAKLRDDASFATRLLAFIEDDAGGSPWADRFAALEDRVRMLEAAAEVRPPLEDRPNGAVRRRAGVTSVGQTPTVAASVEGFSPDLAETPREVESSPVAGTVESAPVAEASTQRCSNEHWSARAAAITVSTGEGRGRKLTAEGIALFEEMAHTGVGSGEIAKVLGMARQSVDTRRAKLTARE